MRDVLVNDFRFKPAIASDAGFSAEPLNELRLFLANAVASGNLPCAVAMLTRGDQVVLHEAVGQGNNASPLRPNALFPLYSMTKPFTAIAMLLLYEQGSWAFEDPISKFLPEFGDFATHPRTLASRDATVRELFFHSSGHSFGDTPEEANATFADLDFAGTSSFDELIGKYAKLPLRFEPGTRWCYNIAVDLQAAIVQRVTGQRFDHFLNDYLFGPLGMRDTTFVLNDDQAARLVPIYIADEGGAYRTPNAFERMETIFPLGNSSFYSTAADYARFGRMLLNRGSLGDARILRPETAELMFTNMLSEEFMATEYVAQHYVVGGGNGFSMNGLLCVDPIKAGRKVGKLTYEWAGAFGPWFWADPENDIVFVGMTNRRMPHSEMRPLGVVSQELVYRALRSH